MSPHDLNTIGTLMVQHKPAGVKLVELAHLRSGKFEVSMLWDTSDGQQSRTAIETGDTLAEAYAKADLSRLRKIAAARSTADIAAAEIASWASAPVALETAVRECAA